MSYRIRYEAGRRSPWKWIFPTCGLLLWCVGSLQPVWQQMAAGEGLYDALARYVGGMILGPH